MELENILQEMNKELFKLEEYPKKIKMKQDFYDYLATQAQKDTYIIEILDKNKQPLSTLFGLKIEIDNNIKKYFEVIY